MMRVRHVRAAAVLLAASLMMVGCATSSPDIAAQTATLLQTRVVAIAEDAAAGNPAAALEDLAALESETAAARAAGDLSAERAELISQAVLLVRADLESRSADVPAPESSEPAAVVVDTDPAPTPVDDAETGGKDEDTGNTGPEPNKGPSQDKGPKEDKGPKGDKGDTGKGGKGKGKDD